MSISLTKSKYQCTDMFITSGTQTPRGPESLLEFVQVFEFSMLKDRCTEFTYM